MLIFRMFSFFTRIGLVSLVALICFWGTPVSEQVFAADTYTVTGSSPATTGTLTSAEVKYLTDTLDLTANNNEFTLDSAQYQAFLNYKTSQLPPEDDWKKMLGSMTAFLLSFFIPILAFLAKLIDAFMSDEFLMGTMGNDIADGGAGSVRIDTLLQSVWVIFRDLMNYIFIFILLVIAFMNVISPITQQQDNYAIKKMLPKLVLAIVAINFTWFGAQVILDVGRVAGNIVFALPETVEKNLGSDLQLSEESKKCLFPIGLSFEEFTSLKLKLNTEYNTSTLLPQINALETSTRAELKKLQKGNISNEDVFSAMKNKMGCLADHITIKVYDEISTILDADQKSKLENAEDYTGYQLSSGDTIYYSKDAEWITTSEGLTIYWTDFDYSKFESGTFAAMYAFNLMKVQNLAKSASGIQADWSTVTINALMSLIIMVLVLIVFVSMAIALFVRIIVIWINIILSPFMGLMMFKSELGLDGVSSDSPYLGMSAFMKAALLPAYMGVPLALGFILINRGMSMTTSDTIAGITFEGEIINGVTNVHQLIWYIMAIGVMWQSVSFAQKSSGLAEVIINPISSKVQDFGKFLAKSPLYFNFIPVKTPNGGSATLNTQHFLDSLSAPMKMRQDRQQRELQHVLKGSPTDFKTVFNTNENVKTEMDGIKYGGSEAKRILRNVEAASDMKGGIQAMKDAGLTDLADAIDKAPPEKKKKLYESAIQELAYKSGEAHNGSGVDAIRQKHGLRVVSQSEWISQHVEEISKYTTKEEATKGLNNLTADLDDAKRRQYLTELKDHNSITSSGNKQHIILAIDEIIGTSTVPPNPPPTV